MPGQTHNCFAKTDLFGFDDFSLMPLKQEQRRKYLVALKDRHLTVKHWRKQISGPTLIDNSLGRLVHNGLNAAAKPLSFFRKYGKKVLVIGLLLLNFYSPTEYVWD